MSLILKTISLLILTCFLACSSNTPTTPVIETSVQRTTSGPLSQQEVQSVTAEAKVAAINYATRKITLKDSNGNKNSFIVSDEVKRLNEIKTGDKIAVNYTQALAFDVRPITKAEMENPSILEGAVAKTDKNSPPAVVGGTLISTILTVKAIDLKAETVTLVFPEGEIITVKSRYPENLKRIKVSDTIVVTYQEGIVVAVKPL